MARFFLTLLLAVVAASCILQTADAVSFSRCCCWMAHRHCCMTTRQSMYMLYIVRLARLKESRNAVPIGSHFE